MTFFSLLGKNPILQYFGFTIHNLHLFYTFLKQEIMGSHNFNAKWISNIFCSLSPEYIVRWKILCSVFYTLFAPYTELIELSGERGR